MLFLVGGLLGSRIELAGLGGPAFSRRVAGSASSRAWPAFSADQAAWDNNS
ncbi:hypothetical protein ACU4GD_42650 [Cupriavidus basilensis]